MSKSTGNVVNPFFALSRFGVDPLRFYLAHDGGISQDADYGNEYIVERYRKGLQGGLGNLASRVLRGKRWSVGRAVKRWHAGELGSPPDVSTSTTTEDVESAAEPAQPDTQQAVDPKTWPQADRDMYALLATTPTKVTTRYNALDTSSACKKTLALIYATNAYLQNAAPWTHPLLSNTAIASEPFSAAVSDLSQVDRTIFLCAEALRLTGIMLSPVMPEKMGMLLDMLGVKAERRTWEWCEVERDDAWGEVGEGVRLGKGMQGVLFPAIEDP
jgi:methionyl-tRNA synthetase